MVFTTLPGIDLLIGADVWFYGGTFSTAPNEFFQIYTINASVGGTLLPIVHALLPDNKQETHVRFLSCFDIEFSKRATIDFKIVVKTRLFRYPKLYKFNTAIFTDIRTSRVTFSLLGIQTTLRKTCPETAHPFFNNFDDNYIGRLSEANGTGQNPRFDVGSRSCHQCFISWRPRAYNGVEEWNSIFFVNAEHPAFHKLIEYFQDEQKTLKTSSKKCVLV